MTEPNTGHRRMTYSEVFAQQPFRVLFSASGMVIAAHTLQIMALSVLVYQRSRSPLLGAVTFGIAFLPQLLGSTLLGALTDRLRPRLLLLLGYGTEAAAAALLALTDLSIATSLAVIASVGFLMPLYLGASNRLIADIFDAHTEETANPDAYVLARSVFQATSSGAQLVGLALGGLAVASLGAERALLVTTGLFVLAGLVILLRLPNRYGPATRERRAAALLRGSLTANRALLASRKLRRLLLAQWLPPMFATSAESLLVPYAVSRGFPGGTAALLLGCLPAGMLAGDLVVGRFVTPATRERLAPLLVLLLGTPLAAFVLAPALPPAAGLLAIAGAGFAYTLGIQRPFVDTAPGDLRGQAFTLRSAGLMTAQGIGPALFGTLALVTSAGAAIALAGAAAICTVPLLRRTQ